MLNLSHSDNQIQCVSSYEELFDSAFKGNTNALCWERNLIGDFSEIIYKVNATENISTLSVGDLNSLDLSILGKIARDTIVTDFQLLESFGASPVINIIKHYEKDDALPFFPTDVYSFHVDRSPIPTNTFLCTYFGESSEIIANSKAEQKILIPEFRVELKKLHQGNDNEFEAFLSEYFFDLHYKPKPGEGVTKLGNGNLWKLAVDHPQSKVLPCIHRAPIEKKGESRLLLIC